MDINTVLIAVVAIVAINYLYNHYITSTKDVNDLYLNEQSIVEATRLPNESAIYKSNKLDYSHGLRIGLDIRYDHYKIRHGNLCDVWQLAMSNKTSSSKLTFDGELHTLHQLNHQIVLFGLYLKENEITSIKINLKFFLASKDIFVIIFAGFLNQITVEFYDDFAYLQEVDEDLEHALIVVDNEEHFSIQNQASTGYKYLNVENISAYDSTTTTASDKFANEYHFSKDKGIALKITRSMNSKFLSTIEFTQLNLISSVASALKHLPLTNMIDAKDKFLIINEPKSTNEHFLNNLTKVFVGLISNSEIILLNEPKSLTWDEIFKINPTILSISENSLAELSTSSHIERLNWALKLLFNQKLKFLSMGKFSNFNYISENEKNLRLIYVNKSLKSLPKISMVDYNVLRCLFSTRIIIESGYYNIVGPVILTDFYDYRLNSVSNLKSFGCISQATEIKLVNIDPKNVGTIMVRGYNIGKTTNWFSQSKEQGFKKYEENKSFMKLNDGFMTLNDIQGIWGNDGCLYVI